MSNQKFGDFKINLPEDKGEKESPRFGGENKKGSSNGEVLEAM
jgi:hypothetical protein